MTTKSVRQRRVRLARISAAVLALGLVAACGEDDAGASSGIDAKSAKAALGPVDKATGKPVKIGYLQTGQTAAMDTTDEDTAARAVARYANEHLGGLAGRPIEVVGCETKGTPSGSQECGSKFVREGVVAVASSSPGEPELAIEQLNAGGIAFTVNLTAEKTALAAKDVFIFGDPLSVLAVPAMHAKDNGLKRAAIVFIDVPAAAGAMKTIAPMLFGSAGATVEPVPVPPGTADMSPQIQTARSEKPDMWYVLGDPNFCATAAKAFHTLGISEPIILNARCLREDAGNSLPGLEKMKVSSTYSTDPADPDWPLFQAVLKQYGDGLTVSGESITGFQGMLTLIRVVNAAKPKEVTAASVLKAIKSAPAVQYPLGGGKTIRCNAPLAAISPNICSIGGLIADADSEGHMKNFQTVDASELYKKPATG